jgi:nucleoside-diphosphate-sugar epimerase
MKYVVIGVGYTGRRILNSLPSGQAGGISRSALTGVDQPVVPLDLDNPDSGREGISLTPDDDYRLLYSVPPASDSAEDRRLNHLLTKLPRTPKTIVYISTSGVYGDCQGQLVDETWPPRPTGQRAVRRYAAEAALHDWCDVRGCQLVVLRVPAIYGPDRLGLDRLRAGEPVIAEAEAMPANRIHVEDLTRCCVTALTTEVAAGIYNVGDGDHRSATWFSLTVARLAGVPSPPQISYQEALQTFAEGRLAYLAQSRRLNSRKLLDEMGAMIGYSNALDGIRASLT